MKSHHVIQISDTHLSEERAYNVASWRAFLRHVAAQAPDFVAVTGDQVLCDPDAEADHAFVRRELERIAADWAAVPGNHDIGDTNPAPYMDQPIDAARLQRYLDLFGSDRWTRELGAWRLIGLNAMLPGSGLPQEAEQDDWLRGLLADDGARPTALFLHKPLCIDRLDETSQPDICVTAAGRDRLRAAFDGADLRLVASGHNHRYRTLVVDGIQMVWAPSSAQIYRTERRYRGQLRPGVVHYRFTDGGVEFGLEEPAGMHPTDVTDLIDEHGAMRFAPRLDASDVAADA